jgi:hypothetical protein
MNKYETFRRSIIEKASVTASSGGPIHVRSSLLAAEHGIPEEHVREQLTQLVAEGFIRLAAWDGRRERPYSEWPDADLFFFNRTDHGYIRMWLRSPGAELLSELPKGPLGFGLR